jgi:hypothetical protein
MTNVLLYVCVNGVGDYGAEGRAMCEHILGMLWAESAKQWL